MNKYIPDGKVATSNPHFGAYLAYLLAERGEKGQALAGRITMQRLLMANLTNSIICWSCQRSSKMSRYPNLDSKINRLWFNLRSMAKIKKVCKVRPNKC
jgi:hypothetical protein